MSGVTTVIIVVLILYVVHLLNLILSLLRNRDVNHAKCIAHIAHYTGNQFAALVLESAANDYSAPPAQAEIAVIANTEWVDGGLNIPALWMMKRARGLKAEVEQ